MSKSSSVGGGTNTPVDTDGVHGAFTKSRPPSKRASTAAPVVEASAKGRGREGTVEASAKDHGREGTFREPSLPDRTLTAEVAVCRSHSRGDADSSPGGQRHPGSLCSSRGAAEQRTNSGSCRDAQADLAPASAESPDVEPCGHPPDVAASPQGSTAERCSSSSGEESFDVYDGESDSFGNSEWSSATSNHNSNSISELQAPSPYPVSEDTRSGADEENEEDREVVDRGGNTPVRNKPAEENDTSKASDRARRKRRDEEKATKRRAEQGGTSLDGAWSNRWLTGEESLEYARCRRRVLWQQESRTRE